MTDMKSHKHEFVCKICGQTHEVVTWNELILSKLRALFVGTRIKDQSFYDAIMSEINIVVDPSMVIRWAPKPYPFREATLNDGR